jgi:squalene-hopene/tetraprenyl-beta-curcumene cyclase
MNKIDLKQQFTSVANQLVSEINDNGFWTGHLSSSALSTAVAIVAFKIKDPKYFDLRIKAGLNWLIGSVNNDGGFGDTPHSESNVSSSLLCYAAIYFCQDERMAGASVLQGLERYLGDKNITLDAETVAKSVLAYYGKDFTFSVPILSMLGICGVVDKKVYRHIPQLPFELSLLPTSLFRFFNLQVVSYAIPALVAVGIFIHKKKNKKIPLISSIKRWCILPALKKLRTMVPESGGFLEAIPLTGFVSMCLMESGYLDHEVVAQGIDFLEKQQRQDGSWPIDTDLSTWVTTLSIKALGDQHATFLSESAIQQLRSHLLNLQYKTVHPFNGAKPGGWGWTNYSGSVPDADDTSGAILSLLELYQGTEAEKAAITAGCTWLINLQNSDGGIPTFCKGWGKLPFDSSCADLTGHTLLALISSVNKLGDAISIKQRDQYINSIFKTVNYLEKSQDISGYWNPLWFGNQLTHNKKNPVYGTAKVATYINDCLLVKEMRPELRTRLEKMSEKACNYLHSQQNTDGSWGGGKGIVGTIEETALAICALSYVHKVKCKKGLEWLSEKYSGEHIQSSPIGLYFATLWYDEKLYPGIYYTEALRRMLEGMTK